MAAKPQELASTADRLFPMEIVYIGVVLVFI